MRQKARLKASFVITIAGSVAQSAACGGTAVESRESPPGTGGAAESGGTPTHTGGVLIGGSGGTGGATDISVNPPPPVTECPSSPPYSAAVMCPPTGTCTETLVCASQSKTFTVDCNPTRGFSIAEACNLPYDHCTRPGKPGEGADCVDGTWRLLGVGGNPPAPCPAEAPAVGTTCRVGDSFGADRGHCGYRCPDGTGWTVVSCVPPPPDSNNLVSGTWQSDGACDEGVPPAK